jgi:TolA-binding protein
MPKLIVLRDGHVERELELGVQDLLIGRSSDNDIVLQDPDRTVSRHHAEVRLEDSRYVVVDVGSQNGIMQDEERVERAELCAGRPVTIGSFTLEFQSDEGPALDGDGQATMPVKIDLASLPPAASGAGAPQPPVAPPTGERKVAAFGPTGTMRVPSAGVAAAGRGHIVTDTQRGARPAQDDAAAGSGVRPAGPSRMPVVLGAVAAVVVVGAALAFYLWPKAAPAASPSAQTGAVTKGAESPGPTLTDAERAFTEGRIDDASGSVEKLLAANPNDAQALALQSRVREAIRLRDSQAAPAASPATPPAPETSAAAPPAAPPPEPRQAQPAEPRPAPAPSAAAPQAGGFPMITRRPGESAELWRDRSRLLNERYQAAGDLLRAGKYAEAIQALSAIAAEERGYQSVGSLLAEARYALATQARQIIAGAKKLEENGDLVAALAELERAKQADPSLPETADLILKLRDHIELDAADAYAKAKQHDAAGRSVEAAEQYDRVVKLLPPSDARRQTAVARLKALRTVGR